MEKEDRAHARFSVHLEERRQRDNSCYVPLSGKEAERTNAIIRRPFTQTNREASQPTIRPHKLRAKTKAVGDLVSSCSATAPETITARRPIF